MGFFTTASNLLTETFSWWKKKPVTPTIDNEEGRDEYPQPHVYGAAPSIRRAIWIPSTWRSLLAMISATSHLLLRPPATLSWGYLLLRGRFESRVESLGTIRVAIGVCLYAPQAVYTNSSSSANFVVGRAILLLEGARGDDDDDDMEQGNQTSTRRGRIMRPIESIIRKCLPTTMIIISIVGLLAMFVRTVHYVRGAAD